jgi:uncharacterized protein (DUF1800 family)
MDTAIFPPLPGSQFNAYKAAHLLWRAGFGGTFEQAEKLAKLGLDAAVDQVVKYSAAKAVPPGIVDAPPQEPGVAGLSETERQRVRNKFRADENERTNELKFWWLNRMLDSAPGGEIAPLQEKMTLFWHGHFATSFADKIERAYPLWQQNEMFRRFALAPLPELLKQLIRDPAMLVFLDNASSNKSHANENFARELMELHSMGVGNYTENDVKAAARALTGFSVDRKKWTFQMNDAAHDDSEKTYLGQTGKWNGDDVVRIICDNPASARFITRKLLEFFVHENPEPALAEAAAQLYRAQNLSTQAFLGTLFRSQLFYSAKATNSIVKSPVMLTIGSLKSMRVRVPEKSVLTDALRLMGQDLFFPPDVNGWAGGGAWINSNMLLVRYNFSNFLLNGVSPDQFKVFDKKAAQTQPGGGLKRREFIEKQRDPKAIDWNPRQQFVQLGLDRKFATGADIVDHYIREFLQRPVPRDFREELLAFAETDASGGRRSFGVNDSNFDERVKGLVHLIMSSPDYQLC